MAQQPNFTDKTLHPIKSENACPSLGILMEHLHGRNSKGAGDNSLSANKSQRIFPFQPTSSGNIKIVPNKVVFESKKVSVLVSEPHQAKVTIKTERSCLDQPKMRQPHEHRHQKESSITPSTFNRLPNQCNFPDNTKVVTKECRPRLQPLNKIRGQPHNEIRDKSTYESPPHHNSGITDVPLSTLGFTFEQPIDWKNISLPQKTDLYLELSRRITSYKNADCIVRIADDEFHCHLLVLQSYSTFFDDKNVKEIEFSEKNVTSKAFSLIYEWMISPSSDSCHLLTRDNILEIFLAAQYLVIKELEEQCWAFIDNDELFIEDTAFLLYLEARKIGNNAIMELMIPKIMNFFLILVGTKDFVELSVEELCILLCSNYISVNSEMEVLMSAVRWLMHNWQDRKEHIFEVLKCVRFGLIAPWQLIDVKRNPENPEFIQLMSYPEVQKMVDDGLAFVIIKYWYGNQTEDYYHWIDLLGLVEPTNRNWAGEDKNYVTYKEFLLYLEEIQKTKTINFKCKKSSKIPISPTLNQKDDSLTSPSKNHINYECPTDADLSISLNSSTEILNNNMPNAVTVPMMISPEFLNQHLNIVDRNGTMSLNKSATDFLK